MNSTRAIIWLIFVMMVLSVFAQTDEKYYPSEDVVQALVLRDFDDKYPGIKYPKAIDSILAEACRKNSLESLRPDFFRVFDCINREPDDTVVLNEWQSYNHRWLDNYEVISLSSRDSKSWNQENGLVFSGKDNSFNLQDEIEKLRRSVSNDPIENAPLIEDISTASIFGNKKSNKKKTIRINEL